ncbi:Cochaperone protein [Rhizophlyctis rosea]|nr:Cochaperone protein [Rhizophlyctis rosea]
MASDSTAVFADANSAFVDEDYTRALSLYTTLVESDPSNAEFLLKRAAAHTKLANHAAALEDARAVIPLATGKADVLGKAHLRRGLALWELGKKVEARDAFLEAQQYAGGPGKEDATLKKWLDKCEKELPKVAPTPTSAPVTTTFPTAIPPPAPYLPPAKIRHEYFQTDTFITIAVFIKNLPQSAVSLNLQPRTLSLTAKLPSGSDYSLELDPLAHEIVPEESKHSVLSTKIEIKLKKKKEGIKWGALEGEETGPVSVVAGVNANDKPAYPSSARKKSDWSSLEKSTEEEKPEGEAALNALFQQIYRDASEDTRRAMMKSFVESNGTCLSTNWDEVGKKKVETSPPEGMVAKKFEI